MRTLSPKDIYIIAMYICYCGGVYFVILYILLIEIVPRYLSIKFRTINLYLKNEGRCFIRVSIYENRLESRLPDVCIVYECLETLMNHESLVS